MTAWARAIRKAINPEGDVNLDLVLAPPGRTVFESIPNLLFEFEGTPADVGGFLLDEQLVAIDRADLPDRASVLPDRSGEWSLRELAELRSIRLEPGRYRIRLELPWARWTTAITVPSSGKALCKIPAQVGLPPLRNRAMPPKGNPMNHPPDGGSWLLVRGVDARYARKDGFIRQQDGEEIAWRFAWEGWEVFNYRFWGYHHRLLELRSGSPDATNIGYPFTLVIAPPRDRTILIDGVASRQNTPEGVRSSCRSPV